ncbi:hypothetical protein MLD38_011869 [Melastoma candidum]|uniref:Uncharacterized protein n=1 Tax=Melastoma candidum TaxID=119954 RepID=A0ACB9R5T0_9MYRT|nr:hypothetical protein MLD38_011869 [Melastoma candidum]
MASFAENVIGIVIVVLCLGATRVGGVINTNIAFHVCSGTINLVDELDYAIAIDRLVRLLARGTAPRGGEYQDTLTHGGFPAYGYASCRRNLAAEECRNCIEIADVDIYSRCSFPRSAQMVLQDCRLIYSEHRF